MTRAKLHRLFLIVALLLGASPLAAALPPLQGRTVLLIHSYHQTDSWTDNEMQGIMQGLRHANPTFMPLVTYLDWRRFPDPARLPRLAARLAEDYAALPIEVVIATDNPALNFALAYRATIFPRAAIVFCGVNGFTSGMIEGQERVSGIAEQIDPAGTLELIFALQPATREIVALFDTSRSSRMDLEALARAIRARPERPTLRVVTGRSLPELAELVGKLGPGQVVLLSPYLRDRSGTSFSDEEALRELLPVARVPIYSMWEFTLGKGIVGGSLLSGKQQGEEAARLALRFLGGERQIPVIVRPPARRVLDYSQLERLGLASAPLPAGVEIINRPASFVRLYWGRILVTGLAFAALLAIIGLLCASIRRRRELETSLRASEAKYRRLYESIRDAYAFTDMAGRIQESNRPFQELVGYDADELKLLTYEDLTPPRWHEPEQRIIAEQVLARGYSDLYEKEYYHRDGTIIPIEIRTFLVRDDQERPSAMWAIVRDISERKRNEERARYINEELERGVAERTGQLRESLRHMESFCYSISHDLRAPLRAIDGYVGMLTETAEPLLAAAERQYLQRISANVRRMGQLIDDLLIFSRLSRQELRKREVALAPLVREVFAELRESEAERQIELLIGDLPPCQADPSLLRQIMVNLLDNALKFTRGQPTARIEVGSRLAGTVRQYYVRDNGTGFDMAYRGKLFGVFQRLHGAEEFEGTGVGLAIVRNIVERHGGQVGAESVPDAGALFWFTLEAPAGPAT